MSVGLAVAQPLGALLRCAPDAKARPIFNWLHRLAGAFAFALAGITLLKKLSYPQNKKDICISNVMSNSVNG